VDAGANVDLADRSGDTPLTLAKKRGHTEMVKILEAAGAR
jgi:ankyrin repeat protein